MRRRVKSALIAILIFGLGGAAFLAVLEASERGWQGAWTDSYQVVKSRLLDLASIAHSISLFWLLLTAAFAAGCLVSIFIHRQQSATLKPAASKPITGCYCEIRFENESHRETQHRSNVHDVFWMPFDATRSFIFILFENHFAPHSQRIHLEGSTSRLASRIVRKTNRYCVILTKQIEAPAVLRISVFGDPFLASARAPQSDPRAGPARTTVSRAA